MPRLVTKSSSASTSSLSLAPAVTAWPRKARTRRASPAQEEHGGASPPRRAADQAAPPCRIECDRSRLFILLEVLKGRAIIPLCFGIPRLPGTQLNSGQCGQFDAHCGRREPNGRSMFVHRMNSGRPATCRAAAAGSATSVSARPHPATLARTSRTPAGSLRSVVRRIRRKRLSPRSRGAAWSSTRCVTQQLRLPVHRRRRVAGAPQRAVSQRLCRSVCVAAS